jgi:peptide/nickel transport system substrate-binding protein
MSKKFMKMLALAAVASVGLAACGSSHGGGGNSGNKGATGKPLVIESTPLAPMTDTFNPYSQSSTSYIVNAIALYNEPLYIYNLMDPSQPPTPMLASGQPTWSNGGKTLTVPIRSGVKFNDGKPFTAADVAFTFNMIKANPKLYTSGAPVVTSATASSPTSVTLNFAQPQYANLFAIAQVYIVPQHIWSKQSDPATFSDPKPVGTGPFMLDKFSPQGFTMKQNPYYWNKKQLKVPELSFPSYNSNTNLTQPIATGQIDWAGNYLANIKNDFLAKSPENHTYLAEAPYFADNNVVGLVFNTKKAPLNDPAVRRAVSMGINRQQISVQAETSYEPPATSSGGLLLPIDQKLVAPGLANDLAPTGDKGKVTSILKADGWTMTGGKWTKNGKHITFAIQDPTPYTDYATSAQLIAHQLNAQGFDVSFDGVGDPATWATNYANGNFDAAIHWSNQGATPFVYYTGWMDSTTTAPIGKPAAGDNGRYNSKAAQSALAAYAASSDPSKQQTALNNLQKILSTDVPVAPLMYGGAWAEVSTRNYTGWPSTTDPYNSPQPQQPYMELTLLHLKPVG